MLIPRAQSATQLVLSLTFYFAFCLTSPWPLVSSAAEEEFILLSIEGDLIGKIESVQEGMDPLHILNAYYALLATEVRTDLETLRDQLSALVPDYEVAFTAADSAELSEVMDEIDRLWGFTRTIHGQEFTLEVIKVLDQVYNSIFPLSGSGPEISSENRGLIP